MSDPVEFLRAKLDEVTKVVEEECRKVQRLRDWGDDGSVGPLYCIDDDYHHPLTGDPLTIITLADATRKLLELHEAREYMYGGVTPMVDCGHCMYPDESQMEFPCPTITLLAEGWGWIGG